MSLKLGSALFPKLVILVGIEPISPIKQTAAQGEERESQTA